MYSNFKSKPKFSFITDNYKLIVYIGSFLLVWFLGMGALYNKPPKMDKGPFINLTAYEDRVLKFSEPVTLEAGADEPFELWNEKSGVSLMSQAETNKEKYPIGWDSDDYYHIQDVTVNGEWKLKRGRDVTIRIHGSPRLSLAQPPDTAWEMVLLTATLLLVWMWFAILFNPFD